MMPWKEILALHARTTNTTYTFLGSQKPKHRTYQSSFLESQSCRFPHDRNHLRDIPKCLRYSGWHSWRNQIRKYQTLCCPRMKSCIPQWGRVRKSIQRLRVFLKVEAVFIYRIAVVWRRDRVARTAFEMILGYWTWWSFPLFQSQEGISRTYIFWWRT